ncbi:MAG: hypothetical protein UY18_C0017G0011 [Microgenomates group bacterium GW2011_GWF2_47_9]|nr:MAG: hypothetical protein UY18_C0017G0011 [Microgenomates group bacterium GW2011_GWF2_47_9]
MRILSIDSITSGGMHAWCMAEAGGQIMRIKKPLAEARRLLGIKPDDSDDILARVTRISWRDRLVFWIKRTFNIKRKA